MNKFVLAALFVLSFSGVAHAQGPQCRTSPVGTSTPSCASEAFVTKSISGAAVTEQKDTGSVGIATSGNCDNTSTNASSPCDHHLALNNATLQGSPSNPTGTTSTTGVMMGLGSTCTLTPVYSARIRFEIIGDVTNSVAGDGVQPELVYGTGTAPINAAAPTGTVLGKRVAFNPSTGSFFTPFTVAGIATGLTPGTAYWFDVNLLVGAGTGSISSLSCNAMEF